MVAIIAVLLSGISRAYEQRTNTKIKGVEELSIPQFQGYVVNILTALSVEEDGRR